MGKCFWAHSIRTLRTFWFEDGDNASEISFLINTSTINENQVITMLMYLRSFYATFFFRRGRFRKLCLQASWPHAAPQLARPSPTQIPRSFIIRHWNVVVTMLYTTYCTNVYYVEICRKYVYFGTLCTIYYSSLFIFILFTDSSISISIHIYLLH